MSINFFFGKNQPDSNIPISEYSSSATTFTMHTFTENNIESDLKKYPLETFQGKNISEFIATNNSTKRQLNMEEGNSLIIGLLISFFRNWRTTSYFILGFNNKGSL